VFRGHGRAVSEKRGRVVDVRPMIHSADQSSSNSAVFRPSYKYIKYNVSVTCSKSCTMNVKTGLIGSEGKSGV